MLFATDTGIHSGSGQSTPITHLVSHLLLQKRLIGVFAVLGLLITGLVLCFVTPRYNAEAVVVVDSRRDKLADAQSAVSGIVVDQYQTALKSELAMITSPALARRVIQSLRLLDVSEFQSAHDHKPTAQYFVAARMLIVDHLQQALAWAGLADSPPSMPIPSGSGGATSDSAMENAVKIFSKHLEAVNDPKSLTLRISYRSTSPQIAAAVANAVADGYLDQDRQMKKAISARSAAWLLDRIVQLRANLETAEEAVENFRSRHDLATHDRAPLEDELLQLKGRRLDAQAQVSAAQAKVVQTGDPAKPNGLGANTDVLNSRLIAGLVQLETQLQAQQAGMLASHRIDSRQMESINNQIRSAQAEINAEIGRYAQANVLELRMAGLRLADINSQIEKLQQKINVYNIADIKKLSLEQDATALRSVLDDLTKRYNQDAGSPLAEPDSRIVSRATVPVDSTSPHYALVLAGGMLSFAGLAFALSSLAGRLRAGFGSIQELGEETGLVVAGVTPALASQGSRRRRVVSGAPLTRELAVTIRALGQTPLSDNPRVILVTSTVPGEGKSTIALSLARSVANAGQRCLLIDADVRKPSLHTTLGVPATPGLVDLTLDQALSVSMIRKLADERFDLLPAGSPTQDILSPFMDERLGRTLTALKGAYDVIILDSAPVLVASEALVLSRYADLTLFLVKWRTTPREVVRKASAMLTRCSAGTCLTVLTQVSHKQLRRGSASAEERYRADYHLAYTKRIADYGALEKQ